MAEKRANVSGTTSAKNIDGHSESPFLIIKAERRSFPGRRRYDRQQSTGLFLIDANVLFTYSSRRAEQSDDDISSDKTVTAYTRRRRRKCRSKRSPGIWTIVNNGRVFVNARSRTSRTNEINITTERTRTTNNDIRLIRNC